MNIPEIPDDLYKTSAELGVSFSLCSAKLQRFNQMLPQTGLPVPNFTIPFPTYAPRCCSIYVARKLQFSGRQETGVEVGSWEPESESGVGSRVNPSRGQLQ